MTLNNSIKWIKKTALCLAKNKKNFCVTNCILFFVESVKYIMLIAQTRRTKKYNINFHGKKREK